MKYGRVREVDRELTRLVQESIMLTADDMEGGFRILDAVYEAGIRAMDSLHIYASGGCDRVVGPEELPWLDLGTDVVPESLR